jgi:excisionase family DNA binding protein
MSADDEPIAISVEEAARRIGVSRRQGYRLAAEDPTFPAYRIGRRLVVSVEGLREWDARQRTAAA